MYINFLDGVPQKIFNINDDKVLKVKSEGEENNNPEVKNINEIGPIKTICINEKENLLFAMGSRKCGLFEINKRQIIKTFPIRDFIKFSLASLNIGVKANFFLNDSHILFKDAQTLYILDLDELKIKKKMILYFEYFFDTYNDFLSNSIYLILEHRVYLWKVDFSNNIIEENLQNATQTFNFDYMPKKTCFFIEKNLCCLIFYRYEMNRIFIYDIITSKLINVLSDHKNNIVSMQMIKRNREILYSWCAEFCIFWNINTGNKIKSMKFPKKILKNSHIIEVDSYLRKLYIGLSNGHIHIFDLDKGCQESIFSSIHFKEITSLVLIGENVMASSSLDSQIKLWKLNYSEEWEFENLNFDESSHLMAYFSPDGEKLGIINTRDSSLYVLDLNTKKIFFHKVFQLKLKVFIWSNDSSVFMINVQNVGYIYFLDLLKEEIILKFDSLSSFLIIDAAAFNKNDTQILVVGSDYSIYAVDIDLKNNKLINIKKVFKEKSRISAVIYHPINFELVCIAGINLLKIINVKTGDEIICFNDDPGTILSIDFSSNGEKICSSGNNPYIKVWDANSGELDYKLSWETTYIPSCLFGYRDSKIYCCGLDCRLIIWNLRSKSVEYWEKDVGVTYNTLSYNNKYDFICSAGQNFYFKKPADKNDNLIQIQCLKILHNLKEDIEKMSTQISKAIIYKLATNYIEPYHFSIFHTLLYLDEYEAFENFIKILKKHKESFPFFEDSKGKNIIDILIDKKQFGILDYLSEYLNSYPPIKGDCSDNFNKSILKIMNYRTNPIQNLLSSRIIPIKFNFPLYTLYFPDIIRRTSNYREPNLSALQKLFPSITKAKSDDKIIVKFIDFPDLTHPLSDFLQLLLANFMSDNSIFVNDVVVNVINYKWKVYGFKIYLFNLLRFLISLSLISVNSVYLFVERDRNEDKSTKAKDSLIINMLLVVIWLIPNIIRRKYTFSKKEMKYRFGFWNIIDAVSTVLLILYIIFDTNFAWSEEQGSGAVKIIHSLTLFFFWMNFLSFGRAFEGTGFMLRILIQVLKDVKYFMIILFTLICTFSYSGTNFLA